MIVEDEEAKTIPLELFASSHRCNYATNASAFSLACGDTVDLAVNTKFQSLGCSKRDCQLVVVKFIIEHLHHVSAQICLPIELEFIRSMDSEVEIQFLEPVFNAGAVVEPSCKCCIFLHLLKAFLLLQLFVSETRDDPDKHSVLLVLLLGHHKLSSGFFNFQVVSFINHFQKTLSVIL